MPNWLKQSTAVDIGIGPFLDSVDGNTQETGLTITAPDIRLKKNGGAFAQKNAAQTLTHEEAGWYEVSLDATDTNTLGILIVAIHESGALPVWKEYTVVHANSYDSVVLGSDKLQTDAVEISGDATAADNCELFFDGTGYTAANSEIGFVGMVNSLDANVITAASIAANAITDAKVAADVTIASVTGAVGSVTGAVGSVTGAVGSVAGAVGSVTAMVTANLIQISGDSAAADNLETMLDGTGGQTLTLKNVVINNVAGIGLSITGSTRGAEITGTTSSGMVLSGTEYGLNCSGTLVGLRADCSGNGPGLECIGSGASGPGALFTGSNAGAGINIEGGSSGDGLEVLGGSASGTGVSITGQGVDTDAVILTGNGAGTGLSASMTGNITGSISSIGSNGISAASIATGAITAAKFAAGAIDAAAIAANAIGASELATDAVAEIALGIGGVGAFAITVTVNDGAAALQNVNVSLYDGGGALAGRGTTDALGNASFSLASGTYTVTLVKANYQFAPVSRTVTGNQAGSLVTPLSMSIIAPIVASVDPDLCVVAGYIKDLNGNALVGSLVKARLVPPNNSRPITSDGNVLGLEADTAVTNGIGYVSMELIRTDEIDQAGCTYVIKCEDAQMEKRNVQLVTATLDIATL